MTQKFQTPRGTRDFMPEDMVRRQYVFEKLRTSFEGFGFRPLETPAFESWELLNAKGGGGDAVKDEIYYFKDKGDREMGLRFELTASLARVVANNPQLPKPFKRYQIGPVWRYDNPQAGRFREFWQADIDTVGAPGMEADAEIIAAACNALQSLGFKEFKIRLNNRKILSGIVELIGVETQKAPAVLRALDKLEKIGEKAVIGELGDAGLGSTAIDKIISLTKLKGNPDEVLKSTKTKLKGTKIAEEGIAELEQLFALCKVYGVSKFIEVDLSLVRGLGYYTGPIFEISAGEGIGSLAGGGRYDKLIGVYGGREEPATGIGMGVERICEVMNQKGMFTVQTSKTKVFVVAAQEDAKLSKEAVKVAQQLREAGIAAESDIMGRRLKQCFEYAEKLGIPYMIIIGEKELASGKLTLKDLSKREQKSLNIKEIEKLLL